jgi:hypothetical protein
MGWDALEASASSGRPLDEEKKSSSFSPFPIKQQQESLEKRAPYGERFHRALGGPVEGLGRFGDACALAAAAGRREEELFFFTIFPAGSSRRR